MRIDKFSDANRLQAQQMYGVAVKAIRDSHSDSHWVGSRSKSYPSFVVKTKRGYSNPPAFCNFGCDANRLNILKRFALIDSHLFSVNVVKNQRVIEEFDANRS